MFLMHFAADICVYNCPQFKQRYEKHNSDSVIPVHAKKNRRAASNVTTLLRELDSSDDDNTSDESGPSAVPSDPAKPWLKEFNHYLNTVDELSDSQTIVQWWGVSIYTYQCYKQFSRLMTNHS
jgi:hypothetical protein